MEEKLTDEEKKLLKEQLKRFDIRGLRTNDFKVVGKILFDFTSGDAEVIITKDIDMGVCALDCYTDAIGILERNMEESTTKFKKFAKEVKDNEKNN